MTAIWVERPHQLPATTGREPVGIDTEFVRRSTFHPRLALVQAARAQDCWLLDPLAYAAGPDLRTFIDGHPCVMHSASEDLEALAPLLGDTVPELFDTQIAAAMCGMGAGVGYGRLVQELTGVEIPKDETRSDWLQRPLTARQLDYAEQDVAHLATLHDKLSNELQHRGRSAWHAEDCARMVRHARSSREHGDPQPQRAFPGAADWRPEAQVRLRRILLWRDATARVIDRPRPWLLEDARALSLAQKPPANAAELFDRVRGQRCLRGPQRSELLALLTAPATPEERAELAPITPAPRGEDKRAAEAMRGIVKTIASRLDLPPGLLCPRRLTDEFVVTRTWPEDLEGWRRGVLEPELATLLPG